MAEFTLDSLQKIVDDIQIQYGLSTLLKIVSNHLTRRKLISLGLGGQDGIYQNRVSLVAARGLPDDWLILRYHTSHQCFDKVVEPTIFAIDLVKGTTEVLDLSNV